MQVSNERREERKRKSDGNHNAMLSTSSKTIIKESFDEMNKKQKATNTSYCGDLTKLKHRNCMYASKQSSKHLIQCSVCGDHAYVKCGLCNVVLHLEQIIHKHNLWTFMTTVCLVCVELIRQLSARARNNGLLFLRNKSRDKGTSFNVAAGTMSTRSSMPHNSRNLSS